MDENPLVRRLRAHVQFFQRSLSCLDEDDAPYQPRPGMLSVVGQVHHVTMAIEFFVSGLLAASHALPSLERFRERTFVSRRAAGEPRLGLGTGFSSMDWVQVSNRDYQGASTLSPLADALRAFEETMEIAAEIFGSLSGEEITAKLPDNPVGFNAAGEVLEILLDHTAHHRGAIAQYARLLGKEPKLPYFELSEALHEAQLQSMAQEHAAAANP